MLNLILIRHGENEKDTDDGGLTANGRDFANRLPLILQNEACEISQIWVTKDQIASDNSPKRCVDTVTPLSGSSKIPIRQSRLSDLLLQWGSNVAGPQDDGWIVFVFRTMDMETLEDNLRVQNRGPSAGAPAGQLGDSDLEYHTITFLAGGTGTKPITFSFMNRIKTGIPGRAKNP
jgi:hypothetical protein